MGASTSNFQGIFCRKKALDSTYCWPDGKIKEMWDPKLLDNLKRHELNK